MPARRDARRFWKVSESHKAILAVLAFGALIAPAMAADLYVKAPPPARTYFSWTGCYIGGDVGGAWSSQNVSSTSPPELINQAPATGSVSASGVIGGGYVGCNYQFNPAWVVGVEGDYSGTHLRGTATATNLREDGTPVGSGGFGWTNNLESIATLRGRLGFVWAPNVMPYATGGGAWGRSSYTSIDAFNGGCPNCGGTSFSNSNSGYVVGAGVDWAPWSNNWIVRLEYLHYGLNGASATANFQPPSTGVAANPVWGNVKVDSVRVGLSYKIW